MSRTNKVKTKKIKAADVKVGQKVVALHLNEGYADYFDVKDGVLSYLDEDCGYHPRVTQADYSEHGETDGPMMYVTTEASAGVLPLELDEIIEVEA